MAKKAIVIGIDGASMQIVLKHVSMGCMPNVKKLIASGVFKHMMGVFPTLTPPGWTSLYTGSWPSTHEVMDFSIRKVNRPLDDNHWGINTELCKSEYLWNTAERFGKIPILVKAEMSWPPTTNQGIQFEGTGPGVCNHHQIAGYHLFVSGDWTSHTIGGLRDSDHVDPSALQDGEVIDPVEITPANPDLWQNLPISQRAPLEVELVFNPLCRGWPDMLRGKCGEPKSFYGLIYASNSEDSAYDRIRICRSRNGTDLVTELSKDKWSDWWIDSFVIDRQAINGSVRMKLLELTANADTFKLFVPQIWPLEGYTYPDEISNALYKELGPFIQNPGRDALGLIDDHTYFELLDEHHNQLAAIAQYLTSNWEWDILFTETHAPDYANHFFLGQTHELSGADPETIKRCKDGIYKTYTSVDRWIGHIASVADNDTIVVIASDHGGTPDQYNHVDINKILHDSGLLVYKDGEIDWTKTKAVHVGLIHIFINLKGREPNGIVAASEYEEVQNEIIEILLNHRDAESGKRPFVLAIRKEYAEILNLWGGLVGDVVFAVHPAFDAAHGMQLPVGSFGIGGQHSTFIMTGPGVRKGVELQRQVRVIDVVPTLCHLLGWPMPQRVEGGVIYEALEP